MTKPWRREGDSLELDFTTSAAGGIRTESPERDGTPIPGFAPDESIDLTGSEISREAR